MSSHAVASYLAECQVVTLRPGLPIFANPDAPIIDRAADMGYFLHEWLHYFHNVSTLQGLSAFANQVHFWSLFRNTTNEEGLSEGSSALGEDLQRHVRQKIQFMQAARASQRNSLDGVQRTDVTVTSVGTHVKKIEGTEFEVTTVACELLLSDNRGHATMQIGTHEILESLAFMLEERLLLKWKQLPGVAPFDPYLAVRALARHLCPDMADDIIIRCMVECLQTSDPPGQLLPVLQFASEELRGGRDPRSELERRSKLNLEGALPWAKERLAEIDASFPIDEPLAAAIRHTTRTIRNNLEARIQAPFVELAIVESVARDPRAMTEVIEAFGACSVVQQREGADEFLRDLSYDFKSSTGDDLDLSMGLRFMHAAFRFVSLHVGADKLLATSELRPHRCPFYTLCDAPCRKDAPDVCNTNPWNSVKSSGSHCWYSISIARARPPVAMA